MYERLPPVRRFDEALETIEPDGAQIRRRSTPYVVGDANDSAERRADQVADRGMLALRCGQSRLPTTASTTVGPGSRIQRSTTGSTIGAAGGAVDRSISSELDGAIGRGRRFEPEVQGNIRRATGHDVSDVRVHTDTRADRLARSMQASAFTVDRNVFFASGQYRPDTDDGMHTVLHESAHLAEGAGRVRRQTIRRRVSTTTEEFDGSFTHHTGVRGVTKSMSSDEIPKIRNSLKRYHKTKPGTPRELEELQILIKLGDDWLRKHAKVQSRSDQARMELIDSIRTQAGMEFGKIRAASIYMEAGKENYQARVDKRKARPGALNQIVHNEAFTSDQLYQERNLSAEHKTDAATKGKHQEAETRRNELAESGEIRASSPEKDRKLTEAIASLSPAEFAAINTYSGGDYEYINQNVGGWGRGKMNAPVTMTKRNGEPVKKKNGETMSFDGDTDDATAKQNREKFEEAGLHAGFVMQAFQKLPVWTGTTYRGMAMDTDFLGLLTKSSYKANDFWSTSEAVSVSKGFINLSASLNPKSTRAVLCRIDVSDGRDVSRISNSPKELEILLPPGSTYKIAKPTKLERGKDDAVIKREFGDVAFDNRQLNEFYLVRLIQSVGKTPFEPAQAKSGGPKDIYPWELMGGRRMLYN